MSRIWSSNLGFPRIGRNREWKRAIEAFWAGKISEKELDEELANIRLSQLRTQVLSGIDVVPVNDFTYYDHVLDTATMFGIIPSRFNREVDSLSLQTYYEMARGSKTAPASEMTKWFNTNYHYIVPEFEADVKPKLLRNRPLDAYREAKQQLDIEGRPVLLGLFSLLKLSKGYDPLQITGVANTLIPLYIQVLQELEAEGVAWIQMDEPSCVTSLSDSDLSLLQFIYEQFSAATSTIQIMFQTYFEAVEQFEVLTALPVHGIGLDFVHDGGRNLQALQQYGFPTDKLLGAGLIDGRNIWRADLMKKQELLNEIIAITDCSDILVQPSCSLLHVPVTVQDEQQLEPVIKQALAFAEEKLEELVALATAASGRSKAVDNRLLLEGTEYVRLLSELPERNVAEVHQAVAQIRQDPAVRSTPFAVRNLLQKEKWNLPLLPTTTIGSFPQTTEVRAARQKWRKGEWNKEQYDTYIQAQIAEWISIQEQIGLDVLVHGEFERTDMVEFFGEKLTGFLFTSGGWVQSYGSRCVKPPIIYADVQFSEPMTVAESMYAQSLTNRPVKGMLTGPVTILNWSFVRDDLSRREVCYQIALALREEIMALEHAGIEMIQVDEPALREGLPLKPRDWDEYLLWAVQAFRISTCNVKDTTQIHTHMCYCEFQDMIPSIQSMDADVISIEASRSHGELISAFEDYIYPLGIGLGVYDIHSPRVPATEEMIHMIERALRVLDPEMFWVNPDCGLKTRNKEETVEALYQMVDAARIYREKLVHVRA